MKKSAIIPLILAMGLAVQAQQPAFPGAEGAGKWALGGRGGTVYEVTTLEDYNPDYEPSIAGSLRQVVEASGPRIVVFRVSGYIKLKNRLKITNPFITIAGQTAPGEGIGLWHYPLQVQADHVIIRYLRSRLTDEAGREWTAFRLREATILLSTIVRQAGR